MDAQQARRVVGRITDSGLLLASEMVGGYRGMSTDSWVITIRRISDDGCVEAMGSPEDWTRIATERGAARLS